MSASAAPNSPAASFRKPAPPSSQRKMLPSGPSPFNVSQASQFQTGSQSPFRGRSPGLNQRPDQDAAPELEIQERDDEPDDEDPEANTPKEGENEIQVSSTNPQRDHTTPHSKSSGTRSLLPSERDTSPAQTPEENDGDEELEDFDWNDFQQRYHDELAAVSKDEEELLLKFDRFSETFLAWSQSASMRDNDRATKRLKTREAFVNMAERTQNQKRQHYEQVVQAFQNAMQLLKG